MTAAPRHPLLPAIGRVMRQEREARGLTQETVARRAGLRVEYVREIEHGRADPGFAKLAMLARQGLGLRIKELMIAADKESDAMAVADADQSLT